MLQIFRASTRAVAKNGAMLAGNQNDPCHLPSD